MKNTNKRSVIVGIFILIGLLIFAAAVLTLGGQRKTFERKITVNAIFDDVGGLKIGNNVWFSGVKIGTVKTIEFFGTSQVKVVMSIDQKTQEYIRKDAMAKIGAEGFIGNKIVVIYGGTEQSPQVQPNDVLAVGKAVTTDEMLETLQDNNNNLLNITKDFKLISDRIANGEGTLGKLLTDEALLNTLEATATSLRQASNSAQNVTANLSSYSSKLQNKGSLTNDLITDTVIFNSLRRTASQLNEMSRTANDVTNNLKMASEGITDKNTPLGTLLTDEETARNLKATLRNLQMGTEKLDDNMEALQHNILFRGFFKKKAKAEATEAKQIEEIKVESDSLKVELKNAGN